MVRKIKKTAVIGAGIMGGGIAALLASAGIKILILDIVSWDLEKENKDDQDKRNKIVKNGFEVMLK